MVHYKIRNNHIVFILIFLYPLFSLSQASYTGIDVVEKSHGLYEVEISGKIKAENTLTQASNTVSKEKLLLTTDTIAADLGKTFGMEFTIRTANTVIIPLKIVWEFPKPMKNPYNQKVYKTSEMEEVVMTNQPDFHSYTLEYDYEFVEGLWGFKIYYNNVEIYSHYFWVILPL
jgi:hypothetical protein